LSRTSAKSATKTRRSPSRRELADRTIGAYFNWRDECAALQDAYDAWAYRCVEHPPFAFKAYQCALDREERAANVYAELVTYVGQAPELRKVQRLTDIPTSRSV
jgi:hypothetical protein